MSMYMEEKSHKFRKKETFTDLSDHDRKLN